MGIKPKEGTTPPRKGAGVVDLVEKYQQVKHLQKMWADQEKTLKERLLKVLIEEGEEDDKGHYWFDLPEEVDGTKAIQRQRRVSHVLHEVAAEEELRKLKLWDKCTRQITVLDEDALLALAFQKKIPDAVMQEIYEEKVVYALYLR